VIRFPGSRGSGFVRGDRRQHSSLVIKTWMVSAVRVLWQLHCEGASIGRFACSVKLVPRVYVTLSPNGARSMLLPRVG
jgi:hypothetical protein